jgi:N-ethylmaleimide reductase
MSRLLLEPFEAKELGRLKNRTVMAAMTRGFADADHCATDRMSEYYARRAEGGVALILTEGVVIHPSADGYKDVPRMFTEKQAASWAPIIRRVHAAGSKIVCQLWHCGRISHPDFTDGLTPVSSTAKAADGINRQNGKPYGEPRALDRAGIAEVYEQYLHAARLAIAAGFDGVQLHLGHGYLADSFFDSRINDRTDEYGGSVENRCRFATELLDIFAKQLDMNKVLVRISPSRDMGGIYDWHDLEAMLSYLLSKLWAAGLRTLDISCARADYYQTSGRVIRLARPLWKGTLLGGASLSAEQAQQELDAGLLDAVTWGRMLIANPDLPQKFSTRAPLNEFSPSLLSELH